MGEVIRVLCVSVHDNVENRQVTIAVVPIYVFRRVVIVIVRAIEEAVDEKVTDFRLHHSTKKPILSAGKTGTQEETLTVRYGTVRDEVLRIVSMLRLGVHMRRVATDAIHH